MTQGLWRLVAETPLLDTDLGRSLAARFDRIETRDRIRPADYPDFGPTDLVLTRHLGQFVKPCPGTKDYRCCGLQIIHLGLGCRIDCHYCILQSYLDTQALVVFGNLDQAEDQIEHQLTQRSFKRFCTGEFTDSLLLENLTGLGAGLVRRFSGRTDAVLELKTKTVNIGSLLRLDHGGRTIISFSVNAPAISNETEKKAPPLSARLSAAAECVRAGYRVGFHFDPLMRFPGWAEGYGQAVDAIFEAVPPDRIAWISLGCFRYLPRLKDVVRRRHPGTRIMDQEFIPAPDGKMRYLRPIRVEMYQTLLAAIRQADPEACVYLCMESPRVWKEVFGFDPGPTGLVELLDRRV